MPGSPSALTCTWHLAEASIEEDEIQVDVNKSGQQRFGLTWCLALLTLCACTTIPVDEWDQIREEVNQDAKETIAGMVGAVPALQAVLDNAVGYLVAL